MKNNKNIRFLLLLFFFLGLLVVLSPGKEIESYGYLSLLPPLVAIFCAWYTREVITSLVLSIVCGGIIVGKYNVVKEFILPTIATEEYAVILLVYLWALGGLIGIWTKTGGAETFAKWSSRKIVSGPRSAKFFTWTISMVFHQGGTISTILTGVTARPVADQHKVSHEELSYVVDSTASPVATIIPFNVWPFYVSGLVLGSIPLFQDKTESVNFFFSSIPYNFYALLTVFLTLLFSLEVLPWYPGKKMKAAITRARAGKGLDAPEAKPLAAPELIKQNVPFGYRSSLLDFFIPIGTLLSVVIIPFGYSYITGAQPLLLVSEAFFCALLSAILLALVKGMTLGDVIDGFLDGCKGVTIGGIILALAISLKEVTVALGTPEYVSAVIDGSIPLWMLPGLLMILCMIIAFATGTSWGTYAVMLPIAMPLAWGISPDVLYIQICFAAVIGGAVFGDQCSPISDTTILSALSTGADVMDHVKTQLPLALLTAGISIVLYTLMGIFLF